MTKSEARKHIIKTSNELRVNSALVHTAKHINQAVFRVRQKQAVSAAVLAAAGFKAVSA